MGAESDYVIDFGRPAAAGSDLVKALLGKYTTGSVVAVKGDLGVLRWLIELFCVAKKIISSKLMVNSHDL